MLIPNTWRSGGVLASIDGSIRPFVAGAARPPAESGVIDRPSWNACTWAIVFGLASVRPISHTHGVGAS